MNFIGGAHVDIAPKSLSSQTTQTKGAGYGSILKAGADGNVAFTPGSANTLDGFQVGSIQTLDGVSVTVFKNVSGDCDFNCHGYTLTGGLFWIQNVDMDHLLQNTKLLQQVASPQAGALIVYGLGFNNDPSFFAQHSGLIDSTGNTGQWNVRQATGTYSASSQPQIPGVSFLPNSNRVFTLPLNSDTWKFYPKTQYWIPSK